MLLWWLKTRRRRQLLAEPFPADWLGYLQQNFALYARLTEAERATLRDELRLFVAEKDWEGCGGLVLTDEIKVTVAAQACLLLLGIDRDSFDRVHTILVYPSGFRSPDGWVGPDGVVYPDTGMLGQAWYRGPVILAWDDVLAGGRNDRDGRNVVLHEFAHQLDYLDGSADGAPPMKSGAQAQKWHDVMAAEYDRLAADAEHGRPKVLDAYGATNPAEFFAVATEAFFEKPVQMRDRHPALYEVMRDYYCQDPVRRFAPEPAAAEPDHPPAGRRKRRPDRGPKVLPAPVPVPAAVPWPGWVRASGFYPGYPRVEARGFLDRNVTAWVVCLACLGLSFAASASWDAGKVMGLTFLFLLTGSAAWLYLVIRWIDRHGPWAGQPPGQPVGGAGQPA